MGGEVSPKQIPGTEQGNLDTNAMACMVSRMLCPSLVITRRLSISLNVASAAACSMVCYAVSSGCFVVVFFIEDFMEDVDLNFPIQQLHLIAEKRLL